MAQKYRGSAVLLPDAPETDLVELIRFYCAVTRRGATAVCREATGDDKLLWDLQGGRRISKDLRADVVDHIQAALIGLDGDLNKLEEMLTAVMSR